MSGGATSRGEAFDEQARRIGAFGAVLGDSLQQVMDKVKAAATPPGGVTILHRTGAATANSLPTLTAGGGYAAYRPTDLFMLLMALPNTSSAVSISVDGLPAKSVISGTGDPLPVPAWTTNSHVFFLYQSDIDKFVVVGSDYVLPPSYVPDDEDVPCNVTGTANAIVMTKKVAGDTVNGADKVFWGLASAANTGAMSVEVAGRNTGDPRGIKMPDGSDVPAGLVKAGGRIAITFLASGFAELIFPASAGAATAGSFVTGSATAPAANQIVFTPNSTLPNNSGYETGFMIRAPADRPVEQGMQLKVIGINDADFLALLAQDGVSQVPVGAWKANDLLLITRDRLSDLFYVISVFPRALPTTASTTPSMTHLYAVRNSSIYALSSFGK